MDYSMPFIVVCSDFYNNGSVACGILWWFRSAPTSDGFLCHHAQSCWMRFAFVLRCVVL